MPRQVSDPLGALSLFGAPSPACRLGSGTHWSPSSRFTPRSRITWLSAGGSLALTLLCYPLPRLGRPRLGGCGGPHRAYFSGSFPRRDYSRRRCRMGSGPTDAPAGLATSALHHRLSGRTTTRLRTPAHKPLEPHVTIHAVVRLRHARTQPVAATRACSPSACRPRTA